MTSYKFQTSKLKIPSGEKPPVVLLACGSFNPITYMHLRMMEISKDFVSEKYEVIGGYLSPVGDAYKKATLIPSKYRIEMADIATSDSDWLMLDLWESGNPEFTPTRQVLDHIRDEVNAHFPETKIRVKLVCGADLLGSFNIPNLWADSDMNIITSNDHYGILCLERMGSDLTEIIEKNKILKNNIKDIQLIPIEILNDISSTKLRDKISKNQSIRYLTSDPVIGYIKNNKLYQPK